MMTLRYRKTEEILPMVAEAIGADLETDRVALLFSGSEIDIDTTLVEVGEFESIQIIVTQKAPVPGVMLQESQSTQSPNHRFLRASQPNCRTSLCQRLHSHRWKSDQRNWRCRQSHQT
jgi:hypothetical protein